MRARSSRSFTCCSNDRALRCTVTSRARSRSPSGADSFSSCSTGPKISVSGVRSSWLTLAKNLVLNPSISRSRSSACCSSPFLRVSSASMATFSLMLRPSGSKKATRPWSSRMGVREKSTMMDFSPCKSPNTSMSRRMKWPCAACSTMLRTCSRASSDTAHQRVSQNGLPTTSSSAMPAPSRAERLISSTVPSTSSRPRNWYMASRMMRANFCLRTSWVSAADSCTPLTEVGLFRFALRSTKATSQYVRTGTTHPAAPPLG